MLVEWMIVAAIVGVTLFYAARSIYRTLKGEKACCAEGSKVSCQLVDLMQEHNLPGPKCCHEQPVTEPRAVEEYRQRMEERRRALAQGQGS